MAARAGGLLTPSQCGPLLQLESDRAGLRERPRTQEATCDWDWWTLIMGCDPIPFQAESQAERMVTINTCEELVRLESLQDTRYDKLKLVRVCLEGQEGLIRGYCQHDYKPISEYLAHLPPSLRSIEICPGLLYLVSSYQNDLMGNGAIFASISRICPLLDTLHM